jgi:hypothetical protein
MLGADYAGYFDHGDARGLADLLLRCRAEQRLNDPLYRQLQAQCAARAPLFDPLREQASLRELVRELLSLAPA